MPWPGNRADPAREVQPRPAQGSTITIRDHPMFSWETTAETSIRGGFVSRGFGATASTVVILTIGVAIAGVLLAITSALAAVLGILTT